MTDRAPNERLIVLLVSASQFVNILDFVIVMPLGPDFARALGIPTSQMGLLGGSYAIAAAVSGFAGSFFLDRFDRRKALLVALFGLAVATALAGTATGLAGLLAARLFAGFFGGPATSLSLAIVADVVPPERRGRAMGTVMGAFSLASIFGVPLALELARVGSWRWPFLGVAALCLVVVALAATLMPGMTGHVAAARARRPWVVISGLVRQRLVQLAWLTVATSMVAGFLIIPNISAHLQQNLGYPRDRLQWLYLVGGVASWVTMQAAGRLNDRYGAMRTGAIGATLLVAVLFVGFVAPPPGLVVMPLFVAFLVALAFRNVSVTTLVSKVPPPQERAAFSSIQSMVQHGATALGAGASSWLLVETPARRLEGVATIAALSMALTAALPFLLGAVERRVRARRA